MEYVKLGRTGLDSSLGVVVMIAKLRTLSPADERHVSQRPARAISPRSASAIA
jgi:hypothetical protein